MLMEKEFLYFNGKIKLISYVLLITVNDPMEHAVKTKRLAFAQCYMRRIKKKMDRTVNTKEKNKKRICY